MKIEINGSPVDIKSQTTSLATLLSELGYKTEHVAVAVNFECVPRSELASTPVHENDRIEVLSPHQGG